MSNFVLQVPDAVQSAIKYGSEYEDFNHPIYQMITHDFLDFFSKNFLQTVNIYMVGSRVMASGTEKSDLSFFVAYGKS